MDTIIGLVVILLIWFGIAKFGDRFRAKGRK